MGWRAVWNVMEMAQKIRYDTWTYKSANSVTSVGDQTGTYWTGMKVMLSQGGFVKYFVITSVVYENPNTTITLDGFGTYVITTDPITAHIDSTEAAPKGFPRDFTDHGNLHGLADDDHTQYLNISRHDSTSRHALGSVVPHDSHSNLTDLGEDTHNQYLNTTRHASTGLHGSTVVDHGSIAGLSDDDHTQYIKHSLATAVNDFLVAPASGSFAKKDVGRNEKRIGNS